MEYIPRVRYQLFELLCFPVATHNTTRASAWALMAVVGNWQRGLMQYFWINEQVPRPLSLLFLQGSVLHNTDFMLTWNVQQVLGGGWELLILLQREHGALGWLLPAESREMQVGEINNERKALLWTDSAGGPVLTPFSSVSYFPSCSACPSPAQTGGITDRLRLGWLGGWGQLAGQNLRKGRGFGVLLPARDLPSLVCPVRTPSCQVTAPVLVAAVAQLGAVWCARLMHAQAPLTQQGEVLKVPLVSLTALSLFKVQGHNQGKKIRLAFQYVESCPVWVPLMSETS